MCVERVERVSVMYGRSMDRIAGETHKKNSTIGVKGWEGVDQLQQWCVSCSMCSQSVGAAHLALPLSHRASTPPPPPPLPPRRLSPPPTHSLEFVWVLQHHHMPPQPHRLRGQGSTVTHTQRTTTAATQGALHCHCHCLMLLLLPLLLQGCCTAAHSTPTTTSICSCISTHG